MVKGMKDYGLMADPGNRECPQLLSYSYSASLLLVQVVFETPRLDVSLASMTEKFSGD